MKINSINNQSFCARLSGDYRNIAEKSVKSGLPVETAKEILSELENDLPEDCTVTFREPQPYSVLGTVFVENSKGVGYDITVSPVLYNKNTLARYAEAAKYLAAEFNYNRNPGLHSAD